MFTYKSWQRSKVTKTKNSSKWKVFSGQCRNVNKVTRVFTHIFDRWFVAHWNGFLFFWCFYMHCYRCHFLFFLQMNWVLRKFWNEFCSQTYVIVGFNRFGIFFIRSHGYSQVLSLGFYRFYQFFRDFGIVVKITISWLCNNNLLIIKSWPKMPNLQSFLTSFGK